MKLIVPYPVGRSILHNMQRTMLLLSIVCTATLTLIVAPCAAQSLLDTHLSLDIRGKDLKEAIDQIAAASKVKIFYSGNLTQAEHKIFVSEKNSTLKSVLDKVLHGMPYSYQEMDGSILIRYDEQKLKKEQQQIKRQKAPPVTGTVTDQSGQPLSGATVKVKERSLAAITNADGQFSLTGLIDNDKLIISFIGYKNKELTEGLLAQNSLIELEEDRSALKEVVVSTGYQKVPLERATGSFSKVDNVLYNRGVSTDVISRLKGISAPLLFDERGGTTKLSIRGRSTIFANDQPLIVVDNFPYDGDINNLNPNDVESVSILKDAAAASIWGVRAGNGVIVITTKKGKKNQPTQLELNSSVTIGNKPDLFYQKQISSSDFIDVEQFLFDKGFYNTNLTNNTTFPYVSPVVDILDKQRSGTISSADAQKQINALRGIDTRNDVGQYFYRKSINQQYELNLKGGSETYTYYFSGGYDKNLLAAKSNGYDRMVLNARQTFNPVKNLDINTSFIYTQSNTQTNPIVSNLTLGGLGLKYPYARLVDSKGNALPVIKDFRQSFTDAATSKGLLDWSYKPYNELTATTNNTRLSDMRFAADLNYKIIDGLSASLYYQYERQNAGTEIIQGADSYFARNLVNSFSVIGTDGSVKRNVPSGGILNNADNLLTSQNGRGQLNFNRLWGKSEIAAIAGFEVRQARVSGHNSILYGYDPASGQGQLVDNIDFFQQYPSGSYGTIPGITAVSGTLDRFRSYYANAAYTYDGKYTLSGSARIDQSNLFGVKANQRSVPLWSGGLKWNISKEGFYQVDWLPNLSIRSSYGYNGNYDNTVSAFATAQYNINTITRQTTLNIVNPPNDLLQWERSGIFNAGIDFALKGNRVYGSIEYYQKNSNNLIGYGPLDPTTGFTQYKGNVAGMKGSGMDLELTSRNTTGKLQWETAYSFNLTKDRITHYQPNTASNATILLDASIHSDTYSYAPIVGHPLFGIYAYKWAGLDHNTGNPQGYFNGQVSSSYNNLVSVPMDSLVYKGRATPSVYGAIRNTFSYQGITLSFNITYRFGYYFRRSSINYYNLFNNATGHSDFGSRWMKPGDEAHTNVPSMIYPADQNRDFFYTFSEPLVDKGDNIRLQDISLSYDLSGSIIQLLHIKKLAVFSYINNVGLLWTANKDHIDPDFPAMPLPRTIAFGLKAAL